ncbi:MAG: hypothetical protein JOS17DRAFT_821596 [Linnemannia elongata]|nr:MAG: hypothetical protein JOS17DRAFT_821596 [Linnemannia elongata]
MKIAIISIALVAMTLVSTEALTLHARGSGTVSSGQGTIGMDTSVSSTSHTVKRTTPDYSSSALPTLRDRLITKRHYKRDNEPKPTDNPTDQVPAYTCQEYIDGIESVLRSVEVSMDEVRKEVLKGDPAQDVLDKLEEIEELVAQTRSDNEAAKTDKYKPQATIDDLVATATELHTELDENMNLLSETTSKAYKDLMMNAGNIASYTQDYIDNDCVDDA